MNQRLLVNSLRRNWAFLAGVTAFAALIWLAGGSGLFSVGTVLGASMAMQWAGPGLALGLVAPREVLILPISQQEIWRTRLWFGIPAVALAMTGGKLLGLGISVALAQPAPGLDTIALSGVLDVSYAAVFSWVFFLMTSQTTWRTVVGVALFLVSPFAPSAVGDKLPVAWNQLTPLSLALITVSVAAGLLAYLRTPTLVTAPSQATNRAALQSKSRRWVPEFSHVTGLWRLLLKVWTTALASLIGTMVAVPLLMQLVDRSVGDTADGWLDTARHFGLMPFELSGASPNWAVFILVSLSAGVGGESMIRLVRHLRTLPMTARGLTAIFMSTSFVAWATAWCVLAGFHLIATGGSLQTWRLPLFVSFFGADCLYRAFQLRWRTSGWLFLAALVVAVPVAFIATKLPFSAEARFIGIGLTALSVATILNLRALTNNRAVYARPPRRTVFGMEMPG